MERAIEQQLMTWYRKPIGVGASTYQALRELRELRRGADLEFGPNSVFILALELATDHLYLLMPPGNADFARLCNGEPCPAPAFNSSGYLRLSYEHHPRQPPSRTAQRDGSVTETHGFNRPDAEHLERPDDPQR